MPVSFLVLAAALEAETPILITATREQVPADEAPASSTVIADERLRRLALPAVADVLRLTPGMSVATTGPRGTQTQLRIRGAEASHSLLFVDGIRFNDPAAGNEARWELLASDQLARIEIVRGPQSALWGSEAIGGVVAVGSPDPLATRGLAGLAEYGSLDSARMFGRSALGSARFGFTASAGWQSSNGVDSLGGGAGDRDGFDNLTASLKSVYRDGPFEVGASGHWVEGRSQYDGFDPVTFLRADTRDETDNRIGAVRGWASAGWDGWGVRAEASYLDSANRNRLDDAPLNSTFGDRLTLGGQVSRKIGGHQLIAALDHQEEGFRARDTVFFGGTDQDRERSLTAFVGEWRAEWSEWLTSDVAVRHDSFSAFADATTFRASLLVRPGRGFGLHAAYGEGIAQPTFFDLYGFFPGSFVGNPNLRPERSQGWEAGLRWSHAQVVLGATGFSHRLHDEIVDVFDPATFRSGTENADGRSRRDGVELIAEWRAAEWLNLAANYTWLDADEQRIAGAALLRETRRARHGFNLIADGRSGRFTWGAALAYVGSRTDTNFDLFPAATVRLDDYVLASLNLGYEILPELELFARAENGLDADYQDVVGYNTPGATIHAGLRVALGR
ncbi:MAG: TonB-dependent receptor domain-containing protein [Allosphingosinicella sp.]